MENASKALLIAAEVLIGIILLTMIVIGYRQIAGYYEGKEASKEFEQLQDINEQFIPYNRDDVRGTDLISLVNKIIDFNKLQEEELITISIIIPTEAQESNVTKFYFNNSVKLIRTGKTYNAKQFEEQILNVALSLESEYPGGDALTLANNLSTLLGENSKKTKEQLLKQLKINYAVDNNDILKYYQYVYLKRAHFNCESLTYNDEGRVEHFTFKFNGKFE